MNHIVEIDCTIEMDSVKNTAVIKVSISDLKYAIDEYERLLKIKIEEDEAREKAYLELIKSSRMRRGAT